MKLEDATVGAKTAVGVIVFLLASVIGGTATLVSYADDVEHAVEDIIENEEAIEKLEVEYKLAIVEVKEGQEDVKRGQQVGMKKIDAISRKFDMLLFELRVREVVSETVAEPPPDG